MPLISGSIGRTGAVIDVLVGVPEFGGRVLAGTGRPVPRPVAVRALIDTGSSLTGFSPVVFRALGLDPVGSIEIHTPSTRFDAPHPCDEHDVALAFVAGGVAHPICQARVIEAEGWSTDEPIQGLIGCDVLALCVLQYFGPDKKFVLAF